MLIYFTTAGIHRRTSVRWHAHNWILRRPTTYCRCIAPAPHALALRGGLSGSRKAEVPPRGASPATTTPAPSCHDPSQPAQSTERAPSTAPWPTSGAAAEPRAASRLQRRRANPRHTCAPHARTRRSGSPALLFSRRPGPSCARGARKRCPRGAQPTPRRCRRGARGGAAAAPERCPSGAHTSLRPPTLSEPILSSRTRMHHGRWSALGVASLCADHIFHSAAPPNLRHNQTPFGYSKPIFPRHRSTFFPSQAAEGR